MKNEVFTLPDFDIWLDALKDRQGRIIILKRLKRATQGNWGDCKPVVGSGGLFEMRIDFGPGYRVYYGQIGQMCFLILAGGLKRSQNADIKQAKKIWKQIKDEDYDPREN